VLIKTNTVNAGAVKTAKRCKHVAYASETGVNDPVNDGVNDSIFGVNDGVNGRSKTVDIREK
jgi:hypothetical protein